MSNSDSSKQTGETQQEERNRKRKDPDGAATSVTMELEVLDCPICYGPLQPPIFQVHPSRPIFITIFFSVPVLQSPFVTGRNLDDNLIKKKKFR
jgi:hypothetical protein